MAQVFLKLTRPPNGQPQVGPHQWVFLRTLADISSGFCGDKTQFSFTGRQTISIPDNGNQKEVLKAKPHCSPNPNSAAVISFFVLFLWLHCCSINLLSLTIFSVCIYESFVTRLSTADVWIKIKSQRLSLTAMILILFTKWTREPLT